MNDVARSHSQSGFSLIELLLVLAIMVILAAGSLPAISAIRNAQFNGNLEQLASLFGFARQAAVTRNTYSWLLFAPLEADQGKQLIVAVVSSKEGTDPVAWGDYPDLVPDDNLVLESRLLFLKDLAIVKKGAVFVPHLPESAVVVDLTDSPVTLRLKVPKLGTVVFRQAIRFSAATGARISDAAQTAIEIDLQRFGGMTGDARNVAILRIDCATGHLQVCRP